MHADIITSQHATSSVRYRGYIDSITSHADCTQIHRYGGTTWFNVQEKLLQQHVLSELQFLVFISTRPSAFGMNSYQQSHCRSAGSVIRPLSVESVYHVFFRYFSPFLVVCHKFIWLSLTVNYMDRSFQNFYFYMDRTSSRQHQVYFVAKMLKFVVKIVLNCPIFCIRFL